MRTVVVCMNCGHEQELTAIYVNERGPFTVCISCDSSYDIDIDDALDVLKPWKVENTHGI